MHVPGTTSTETIVGGVASTNIAMIRSEALNFYKNTLKWETMGCHRQATTSSIGAKATNAENPELAAR